mmetsp:Transcript_10055/g.24395  ORF Transcript_10055/g.24395 Transcript_10055/m.24395 type:complete len:203 (+) Transcript_10055:1047-1655(+)
MLGERAPRRARHDAATVERTAAVSVKAATGAFECLLYAFEAIVDGDVVVILPALFLVVRPRRIGVCRPMESLYAILDEFVLLVGRHQHLLATSRSEIRLVELDWLIEMHVVKNRYELLSGHGGFRLHHHFGFVQFGEAIDAVVHEIVACCHKTDEEVHHQDECECDVDDEEQLHERIVVTPGEVRPPKAQHQTVQSENRRRY